MTAWLLAALVLVAPAQCPLDRDPWKVLFQVSLGEFGFLDYLPEEVATPAVDARRGLVFVGSRSGLLLALDGSSGRERWRMPTKGAFRAGAVVARDTVFAGNMDGIVWALDADTGAPRWRTSLGDGVISLALADDGALLARDARGGVQRLEARTGVRAWRVRREVPRRFTIASEGGLLVRERAVIAGFPDGHLLALDVATGDAIWDADLSGGQRDFVDVASTPLLAGELVVAVSYATGLHALDAATGVARWKVAGPAFGHAVKHQGRLLVVKDGTTLLDVEPATGEATPRLEGLRRPVKDLASRGGHLWLADGKSLRRLDLESPAASLTLPFLFGVSQAPAVAGARVYIVVDSGYIYGVEQP